ncbi:reverse transcriptase domain-containing protein [Tanacetum coccineum]|uniref:Reverse transcriptase domain-containing protein n=1 Tax=Tanacetum coccineum TaxID=301880 RepID=A0ABQ5AY51_9ASTR
MKLNPKKCIFSAEEGAFLGHVVSTQGIKACPEKTEAGSSKHSPTSGKGLAAALVHTTRRLRRYFQAHPVVVITDQPIKQILSRPENIGRMLKWKFELDAFDITYRPRTSIRGKILADFIAEKPDEEGPSIKVQAEEATLEPWTLFTDGSSCLEGPGARLILTSPEGEEFTYTLRFEFDASNNEAEYEALVAGLRIAEQMGLKNLIDKVDSRLVANQINGLYEAKEQSMTQYLEKAKTLINNFKMFSIEQMSRSKNKKAGALSKIASTSFAHLTKQVLVEILKRKSIEEREILAVVEEEGYCWMTPLVEYLTEGTLSVQIKKARMTKIKARQYTMVNGRLIQKVVPGTRVTVGESTSQSIPSRAREGKVLDRSHQLLYKVDRSKASGNNNGKPSQEICMGQYCVQIRTSRRNYIRQRKAVQRQSIQGLVRVVEYQAMVCILNQAKNDEGLLLNLDILEERREKAAVREAKNKAKMEKYYNAKVRSTSFRPGDFVYRSNDASHAKESEKLGLKWEGPYEVVEALGKGAYKLRNRNGYVLPRTWNVQDLKKCYL